MNAETIIACVRRDMGVALATSHTIDWLRPDGIAVLLHTFERAAPDKEVLGKSGLRIEKRGWDSASTPGSFVLWTLRSR